VENGKMLGDCDDWAFLAREILKRQGKQAFVVGLPKHAECFWIEKRIDGRFDAYSMGTSGLDYNGFRDPNSSEAKKGYATIQEAFSSLLKKYGTTAIGTLNGKTSLDPKHIEILTIPAQAVRGSYYVPLFAFEQTEKARDYVAAIELEHNNKPMSGSLLGQGLDSQNKAVEARYEDLAAKYPQEVAFLEKLAKIYESYCYGKEKDAYRVKFTEVCKKIIKIEPSADIYLRMSNVYSHFNPDEAIACAIKAVELEGAHPALLDSVELALEKKGASNKFTKKELWQNFASRVEEAIKNKNIEITKDTIDFMAFIYFDLGQSERLHVYMGLYISGLRDEYISRKKDGQNPSEVRAKWQNAIRYLGDYYFARRQYGKEIQIYEEFLKTCGRDDKIERQLEMVRRLKKFASISRKFKKISMPGISPIILPSTKPE